MLCLGIFSFSCSSMARDPQAEMSCLIGRFSREIELYIKRTKGTLDVGSAM